MTEATDNRQPESAVTGEAKGCSLHSLVRSASNPDLRADDARVACPLFQAEYGGSTPTSALQLRVCKINRGLFQTLNRAWHSRLPECGNCFMGQCYGAESGNKYYAVAWWSHPVNAQLTNGKTWELRRMAVTNDAPPNTASRFLAIMVKLLRKERPELEKLISYQDAEVHKGTIYKAAGWTAAAVCKGHSWTWGKETGRKRAKEQSLADKVRWELQLKASTPNSEVSQNAADKPK